MEPDELSRIALLSLGPAIGMGGNRRGVGGATALERQIDVALALGCRRIWLYAQEQDGLAVRAQAMAEAGGAQFRLIHRGRQLLGSLRRQDNLLVLAEGLLPADRESMNLLDKGPVILTLPAESGTEAGFERLDRDNCWAGAMVLPGRAIEQLEALGEEMDPVSALVRAGRVARVAERALPENWISSGRWSFTADRVPLSAEVASGAQFSPVARYVVRPLAARLVERPVWSNVVGIVGAMATIGAAGSLYLAMPAAALLLVAAAGVLLQTWLAVRAQRDPRVFSAPVQGRFAVILPLLAEPVGAAALIAGLHSQYALSSTLYTSLLTISVWLLAGLGRHGSARIFAERTGLWLAAGLGGLTGSWIAGPALTSVLALGAILLNLRNQPAITQA